MELHRVELDRGGRRLVAVSVVLAQKRKCCLWHISDMFSLTQHVRNTLKSGRGDHTYQGYSRPS